MQNLLNDFAEELDSLRRLILRVPELSEQPLGAFLASVTLRDDSHNFHFGPLIHKPLDEGTSASDTAMNDHPFQTTVRTRDGSGLPNGAGRKGRNMAAAQFLGEGKNKTQIAVQDQSRRWIHSTFIFGPQAAALKSAGTTTVGRILKSYFAS